MPSKKQPSKKTPAVRKPTSASQLPARRTADIFGQPFLPSILQGFGDGETWAPAIHVLEKNDKFVAKVELPGVNAEDVNVSVMGDMLVIEGEKEAEQEVKEKGYSYRETSYGSFSRSITIPSMVDADRIEATFDKGVLEIDLPKAAKVKPKKVAVKAKKKAPAAKKVAKAAPASS